MKRKNLIGTAVLAVLLGMGSLSGCVSTDDGTQGIETIESMSDVQFAELQNYLTLGLKITARRLLDDGAIELDELSMTATALETVRDKPVVKGATSLLVPALQESGLHSDEIELLVLVIEQELLSRGPFELSVAADGTFNLSPRTQALLTSVANALRHVVENYEPLD